MSSLREPRILGLATDRKPLITRIRFQLLVGLVLCVFLPWYFKVGGPIESTTQATANNAVLGAIGAYVVGFYLFRQLSSFPGVKAGANTLLAVFLPFAVVAVVFLLFRLDYSRFIFAASFSATFIWFLTLQFTAGRYIRQKVSVVPGGQADGLMYHAGVEWDPLREPPDDIYSVEAVAADLRYDLEAQWERFLVACALAGKPVYHSKHLMESLTGKVQIEHMSENSFGSLLPNLAYLKVKQISDWLLALFLLPFFGLLYLLVAPAIVLSSGWPAIFTQERIGFRGKVFRVYKFRTMNNDSDGDSEPMKAQSSGPPDDDKQQAAITVDRDKRVTPIGRFLRRFRIDEAPQIVNILKGEMSWIGPRPEALSLARWYEGELAFYPYRHIVKPGITGWAQVNQGHVAGPEQVREKLHYDFFYIKYLSPWLDMLIALRTVRAILTGFGAK